MLCGKTGILAGQDLSGFGYETGKFLHVVERVVHRVKGAIKFLVFGAHEPEKSGCFVLLCKH